MRSVVVLGLLAFGSLLAACSSDSSKAPEDPNVFPKDYQREILSTLTNQLEDPTNVREAAITEPVLRAAGREQRYTVCVRYNARNASRHYEGVKERVAYFYAGSLNQLIAADQGQCQGAAYKPWPELEKYCLAKSCV
ncbi:hypothetical protein MXD81_56255 [Microbacteriaceae bacterium K1510]|nr:hypothetical protein [Microbacteriaceae bacterium K1510]